MYETCSIISGVALFVMALLPGLSVLDRLGALVGGALCLGYGIYVSQQTSGTWYFSSLIFVVPFWVAGYLGYVIATRGREEPGAGTAATTLGSGAPIETTPPAAHPVAPPPDPRSAEDQGRAIARTVFAAGALSRTAVPPVSEGQRTARAACADRVHVADEPVAAPLSPSHLVAGSATAGLRDPDAEGARIAREVFRRADR